MSIGVILVDSLTSAPTTNSFLRTLRKGTRHTGPSVWRVASANFAAEDTRCLPRPVLLRRCPAPRSHTTCSPVTKDDYDSAGDADKNECASEDNGSGPRTADETTLSSVALDRVLPSSDNTGAARGSLPAALAPDQPCVASLSDGGGPMALDNAPSGEQPSKGAFHPPPRRWPSIRLHLPTQ
jgi:hypothetical protein